MTANGRECLQQTTVGESRSATENSNDQFALRNNSSCHSCDYSRLFVSIRGDITAHLTSCFRSLWRPLDFAFFTARKDARIVAPSTDLSTQSANGDGSATSPLARLAARICFAAAGTMLLLAVMTAVSGHPIVMATAFAIGVCAGFVLWVSFRGSSTATIRLAVLISSMTFSVAVCELLLRVFTMYPVHGNSNVVVDVELGFRMDPALPDADANGFRNPVVRTEAQIVAIGDSHTQGFNVESADAWPMQLGRKLDKTAYNFGTGGYGPLHYERLLSRALAMHPEVVAVGIYLPNDLSDVVEGIHPRMAEPWRARNTGYMLRDRTAIGSLLWQTARQLRLDSPSGIDVAHRLNPTFLSDRGHASGAAGMDLRRPEIAAAFQLLVEFLKRAREQCRNADCHLVILLIPSRERVYETIVRSRNQPPPTAFAAMVSREREVTSQLAGLLQEFRIDYADATPGLVNAIDHDEDVYPATSDGHPLRTGYKVYADAVCEVIQSIQPPVRAGTN